MQRYLPAPGRFQPRTPGSILVRVPLRTAAGKPLDWVEARETLADKPWAHELRYLGTAGRHHCFERLPGQRFPVHTRRPFE